jgi:hypothetical protein
MVGDDYYYGDDSQEASDWVDIGGNFSTFNDYRSDGISTRFGKDSIEVKYRVDSRLTCRHRLA